MRISKQRTGRNKTLYIVWIICVARLATLWCENYYYYLNVHYKLLLVVEETLRDMNFSGVCH